jgi:hypothetical protein
MDTSLIKLTRFSSFHHSSYGMAHHGYGIGHMILSAVVHGLIYNFIFHLFAHVGLGLMALITGIVLLLLFIIFK